MIDAGRAFLPVATNRFDASGAREYGELLALVPPPVPNPFRQDHLRKEVMAAIERYDFDPDVDYLVQTGPVAQVAQVTAYLLARYGRLQVLIFHAADRRYTARVLTAPERAP